MKAYHKIRSSFYISLRLGKKKATFISILLAIAILNLSVSCSYYTVKNIPTTKETVSKQIQDFNTSEKYVFIHSKNQMWHLGNMVINEDHQTLSGTILPINEMHQYRKLRDSKKVHGYSKERTSPLNELHIYLNEATGFNENAQASIPLADINRVSVNDKNTGRAVANVVLTTVGAIFVVALIVLATKSSCPFVYIKNGVEFDFVGELYPGTITANMQKDDYLPLPNFSANNNEYLLKVTNQLKEIQYTDQLQLLLANHQKDIEVLLDSKGQIQTFKNLNEPTDVTLDNGIKNRQASLKKDNEFYAFNTSKATSSSTRNIVFEFEKPKGQKDAKLYLTAKNSVWLDYIFGKFNEQFGVYYKTFQKKQQKVAGDSIRRWSESQNIPLLVYLNTNDGWELIEKINTVGPMAMRDIAVPLNLDKIDGHKLQIKLETGFMFWEVDFVGVDFSENEEVALKYVNPSKAIDQYGTDVVDLLLKADQHYFVQPNIDDEVTISFPTEPVDEGIKQTVFLKNRGYYNYIRSYKGIPDFENLKTFREDHAFTRFSEKAYFEFVNFDLNTLAYHE